MQKNRIDLKAEKAREVIKNTLKEIICEKNVSNVTVKELSTQAHISKKSFYSYYDSIEALFEDILQETEKNYFIELKQVPLISVNRVFFTYLSKLDTLTESLFCSESYRDFCSKLFILTVYRIRNQYNPYAYLSNAEQNIVNVFISQSSIDMYRKWVEDGKKITIEQLIELSSKLINNGSESLIHSIL